MADTKISALSAVAAVIDADEFAVNDAGTSKKASAVQVRSYAAIQPYATGSFTVPTESFVVMSNRLKLTGSQRATVLGTGRLRVT